VGEDRSNQLRLYQGPAVPVTETAAPRGIASRIESICDAFCRATGRRLRFVSAQYPHAWHREVGAEGDPLQPWLSPVVCVDGNEGRLCLDAGEGETALDALAAHHLARVFAELLHELTECQRALREREAELAACIPPPLRRESTGQFTDRLESVLRGGAQALDCQAAAMYLLDDETAHLKLRATWGLPALRLAEEARPLEGATADLEALVGHAVVLEDERLFEFWRVPESGYAAAICIPLSSPTTILGTLWFYSLSPRSFTKRDTNLAEIIAGRLASDLERKACLIAGQR
jgi:hypothetical protein